MGLVQQDQKCEKHDFQIKMLMNMMIHQEEWLEVLDSRVTAAFQRELKQNIIILGILEKIDETRKELIGALNTFFTETMEIEETIEIQDAFRMGGGNARPITVKLKHPSDKAVIFGNASKLQGKQNSKKKLYFVHNDMTDEQSEIRKMYQELVKENKSREEEDKLKIKMQRGRIVVNNEVIKHHVQPPTKADILRLSDEQLERICAAKTVQGPEHLEKGSEYYSYAVKYKSKDDMDRAYKKVRIKHADATHVSCAYQLKNPCGPFRQESIDDKDYGVGRTILKTMKEEEIEETAVYIVRYYGKVHLGNDDSR